MRGGLCLDVRVLVQIHGDLSTTTSRIDYLLFDARCGRKGGGEWGGRGGEMDRNVIIVNMCGFVCWLLFGEPILFLYEENIKYQQ